MDNSHTELGYEKESDGDEFGDMQVDIRKQKEEQSMENGWVRFLIPVQQHDVIPMGQD